jgi:hypothetical protein
MGTVAVGSFLLATATRSGGRAAASPADSAPARPVRDRDRYDPPSLQRAKSEPLPGLRELAEFAHPALAIIGLGFWLGYVLSHDRLFAAVGLGILLGAICAGLSWFTVSTRAARNAATAGAGGGAAGGAGREKTSTAPLSFSSRLLIWHGVGAALTLLFAALIAARA